MDRISRSAVSHIHRMEDRIAQQNALIVHLRESGQSTHDAAKHLILLRNTLAEMRVQLGALAPTRLINSNRRMVG